MHFSPFYLRADFIRLVFRFLQSAPVDRTIEVVRAKLGDVAAERRKKTFSPIQQQPLNQGDQIGRNFTCLILAYLKKHRLSPYFWTMYIFQWAKLYMFYKNRFGYILGDFLTNSSGHPALDIHVHHSVGRILDTRSEVGFSQQVLHPDT
jgi:hypothetical protein